MVSGRVGWEWFLAESGGSGFWLGRAGWFLAGEGGSGFWRSGVGGTWRSRVVVASNE